MPTNPAPINRLTALKAYTLYKWLLTNQPTWIGEPSRLLAERASRELGFKITVHNMNHMRLVFREIGSPTPPPSKTAT